MPGGARTQLTFSREPSGSGAFVPGESRSLTYLRDVGGNEEFQIYRLDLDGGVTLLTDGKSRHVEPALVERSGKRIA